ncbi:MAG: hypothetical protein IPP94_05560 [Ignavibacteria bacterium]|nr:hypothetical protein [Ignavibacteria bacterium]
MTAFSHYPIEGGILRRILLAAFLLLPAAVLTAGNRDAAPVSPPPGANISGTITITKAETPEEAVRRFTQLNRYAVSKAAALDAQGGSQGVRPMSDKAVVFLEGGKLNKQKYPTPTRRPLLDQKDMMFHPRVLAIMEGTTVDFPNKDVVFHNVFSYSGPREFDLGRYPKGDSRSVRFDAPGIIRVYCDIHAHMNATIIVLEHPFFAVPDESGKYSIENVPDGEYTLTFWYDRDVVSRKPVTILNGAAVTVDLQY